MSNEIKLTKENLDAGEVTVPVPGGQRVTLSLIPTDVHDSSEIPTYLAGYHNGKFRADEASPVILVDRDEDKYRNFAQNDAFRLPNVKGSTSGAVPEVDPSSSLSTYKVVERFIGSFIPKQTEMNADNMRPVFAAARRCRAAIDLDRENDVWTLLETNTNWATAARTAASNTWDDATNGTPLTDVQTAIQKSSQEVTNIFLNTKVAHAFLRHPEVKDHMRQFYGDNPVPANSNDFAIPGLPPFHIVNGKIYNESTAALDYILGDVAVLISKPAAGVPVDGEDIASSYTFRRRGPSGVGYESRQFAVEGRGPLGGTMVVISQADIAKMPSTTAGGIITSVHS